MNSEQVAKLTHRQSCLPNNRAKCAFRDLVVIGNRQSTMWGHLLYQNHMATLLSIQRIANLAESIKDVPARDDRQPAQSTTSTTSS